MLKINNPILTNTDMLKIKNMKKDGFKVVTLSTLYYKSTKLERAIDRLFVEVDKAFREEQTSWFFLTAAWMRTICRSRPCWRFPQYISIL